jgi:signal transduction histidine kinase
MTLVRRNILAAFALALPAAIAILFGINWLERRDRAVLLETIALSVQNEIIRDACVNDPQWFLAGVRIGRPRPEERLQPDADVRLPRPSPDPLPFEYFAYDEDLSPSSVAGPRFPDAFKRAMRTSPPERIVTGTYSNALGTGVQTAVVTRWSPGPCSVLLFRQLDPPNRLAARAGLFVAIYAACFLITYVAAAPTAARIRNLSQQARNSTRNDYAAMVDIKGSDEIGSLGAVFNDSAGDIRQKAADIRDREEALRRYVEHTTEEVAPPLAALEDHLVSLGGGGDDPRLRHAVREAHRLTMALRNQAAVTKLRGVTDSSPRESIDLSKVVRDLTASRRALAAACEVTIDVGKVGGSDMGASAPVIVQADPLLIEQAIANVLDNAIIYNNPGGSIRVELSPYDHGRRFRLLIADTGPGVTDEEFAGLTANKRFRGDESRTRRPGGRGLGLALAREVADRFGMQLDLRQPAAGGFEAEFSTR